MGGFQWHDRRARPSEATGVKRWPCETRHYHFHRDFYDQHADATDFVVTLLYRLIKKRKTERLS